MAEESKPKTALEKSIEEFENEVASSNVIRKELIQQLREDAKKMRVSEFDKAMMVGAKMSIITTLNTMLNDCEASSLRKAKLRMTQHEQENSGQYSQAIVELLKMVRADGKGNENISAQQPSDEEIQNAIDKRGKDLKIEVSEGEIEEVSSMPLPPEEGSSEEPPQTEKPKEEKK